MAEISADNIGIVDYPYYTGGSNLCNFDLTLSQIKIPMGCYKHSISIGKNNNNETEIQYIITPYNVNIDTSNDYQYTFTSPGTPEDIGEVSSYRGITNIPRNFFTTHNNIYANISSVEINTVKSTIVRN